MQVQSQAQEAERQNKDTSPSAGDQSVENVTATNDHFLVKDVVSQAQI
jgi:hypothetical protein